MRFEKWQALGNDYIIVEQDELPFELTKRRVELLCAPHTGVGSDGVLLLSRPEEGDAVASLRIFNPDGSEAELSGNGAREAILLPAPAGLDRQGRVHAAHSGRRDQAADHRADHVHGGHGPRQHPLEGLPERRR